MKSRRLLSFVISMLAASLLSAPAYAATAQYQTETAASNQNYIPITFEPACTTKGSTALWRITNNQNAANVSVAYTNIDTGVSETLEISPSTNTFLTKVAPTGNNTTKFVLTYGGNRVGESQTNAQSAPCATPVAPVTPEEKPACDTVDKYHRDRLRYEQLSENSYSVSITPGLPLCDDVDFYLSSYELPATYDKSGNFNESASPQTRYASDMVSVKAGATGLEATTMTVSLPTSCNSYQVDLYFGPEVTQVTYENNGHGEQNIEGIIRNAPETCGQNPTPGQGGGTQPTPPLQTQPGTPAPGQGQGTTQPPAPVAVQAAAPVAAAPTTATARELPAELPATGPGPRPIGPILTLMAMVATYGAAYGLQKRQTFEA